MTPRENTIRAIEFTGPERVPVALPGEWGNDFLWVSIGPNPDWQPAQKGQDEWGSVWGTIDSSMGQVQQHPLADWNALDTYEFPDFLADVRWQPAKEALEAGTDNYVIGGLPNLLWERMHHLRGLERVLADFHENHGRCEQLADRIADLDLGIVNRWADLGVNGIMACEDWGVQDRLLISPKLWREFFKPRYARIFSAARDRGLHVFVHSCGYITDILGDWIECGLNVIQMDQQENMGLERLGREFGGKVCFWCPVDIQQTMVYGTVEDVAAYARTLIDTLGSFNGGFMAGWYAAPKPVGHTEEKIQAMCKAFVEYGRYPLRLQ